LFPILETERLILRGLTKDDAQSLFNYFSNEEVTRYYGQEPFIEFQQAEDLVDLFSKNFAAKSGIRWGIERKGEKGIIGTIGFHAWSPIHRRAEIGYDIHPDYWRKGYMQEAVTEIVSYGFQNIGLTRIGAVVFIENEASNYKLLTKIGFQKEGILRDYMYQNGLAHDTFIYSILNNV